MIFRYCVISPKISWIISPLSSTRKGACWSKDFSTFTLIPFQSTWEVIEISLMNNFNFFLQNKMAFQSELPWNIFLWNFGNLQVRNSIPKNAGRTTQKRRRASYCTFCRWSYSPYSIFNCQWSYFIWVQRGWKNRWNSK